MATRILSLTIFILFLISANGRSFQKKLGGENVNYLSHFVSTANAKLVKSVSRATSSSYTTNYTDVLGLTSLVTNFPSLAQLSDDPCVAPIWNWIECSSDPTPRVIALDLNNRILYGQLDMVTDFSSMDALQRIDLSQNFLYGLIPSFLGEIPDLQELNLGYNYLSGTVPNSIACNKNLKLTIIGNTGPIYNTCSPSKNSPSSPGGGGGGGEVDSDGVSVQVPTKTRGTKKKSHLAAILGSTISAFVVFWAAIGGYALHRHKAKIAAAVAQASSDKQVPAANVPVEELPMNSRPHETMSPSS